MLGFSSGRFCGDMQGETQNKRCSEIDGDIASVNISLDDVKDGKTLYPSDLLEDGTSAASPQSTTDSTTPKPNYPRNSVTTPSLEILAPDTEEVSGTPGKFTPHEAQYYSYYAPYTRAMINQAVEWKVVPGKGRCLFAKLNFTPGEIILAELPVYVSDPTSEHELWQKLEELNNEEPLFLSSLWQFAALQSMDELSVEDTEKVFSKYVPEDWPGPELDALRIKQNINPDINVDTFVHFLKAWRFNSFGHSTNPEGLVMYDIVSLVSHHCDPSCSWHYGLGNLFVIRARKVIKAGEEITLSYIGEDGLRRPTHIRRQHLRGWEFDCKCDRCLVPVDDVRGFLCFSCGAGSFSFRTEIDGTVFPSPCDCCGNVCTAERVEYYLNLEEAYASRLQDCDAVEDLADVQQVLRESERVFNGHFITYELLSLLCAALKENHNYAQFIHYMTRRIEINSRFRPRITFVQAWHYEELGDVKSQAADSRLRFLFDDNLEDNRKEYEEVISKLSKFDRYDISWCYERALNSMLSLCGDSHESSCSLYTKLDMFLQNS